MVPPGLSVPADAASSAGEADPNAAKYAAVRFSIMLEAVTEYTDALNEKQSGSLVEGGVDTRPKRDDRWGDIHTGVDTIKFGARDMEKFAKEHGLAPYESMFESPAPLKPDVPLSECQSCSNAFERREAELLGIRPPPKVGIRTTPREPPAPAPRIPQVEVEPELDVFDPKSASIKELIQKAEETGDPELQYLIGARHAEDLPPNLTEAARWLTKAANQKHRKAQVAVAKMDADQNHTSNAGTKHDTAVRYLMTHCSWSHVDAVTEITGKPPAHVVPTQQAASVDGWGRPVQSGNQWDRSGGHPGGAGQWGNAGYGQQQPPPQQQHGSYGQRQPDSRGDYRQNQVPSHGARPYGSGGRDSYGEGGGGGGGGGGGWDRLHGHSSSTQPPRSVSSSSSSSSMPPGLLHRAGSSGSTGWAGSSGNGSSGSAMGAPPRQSASSAAVGTGAAGSSITQDSPRIPGKIPKKIPKKSSASSGGGWDRREQAPLPSSSTSTGKRERDDDGGAGAAGPGNPSKTKKPRADPADGSKATAGSQDRVEAGKRSHDNGSARAEKKRPKVSAAHSAEKSAESRKAVEQKANSSPKAAGRDKPALAVKSESTGAKPKKIVASASASAAKKTTKQAQKKPAKNDKKKKAAADSGESALFPPGTLVWAKVGHYQYWPATAIGIDEVADEKSRKQLVAASKKKNAIKGAVLVMFFQSRDVSWIKPDRICKFVGPDSAPDNGKRGAPDFEEALTEAMEQIESDKGAASDADDSGAGRRGDETDGSESDSDSLSELESDEDDTTSSDDDDSAPAKSKPPSGSGDANVKALKAKYKELKGAAARGSQANNPEWLSARIKEMDKGGTNVFAAHAAAARKQKEQAAKKKAKAAAAVAAAAAASGGGATAQAAGDDDPKEVASLKARYKQLKGSNPRGSKANEAAWLRVKVAELEAEQGSADNGAGDDNSSSEESDLGAPKLQQL
jgi:hypothetical protein